MSSTRVLALTAFACIPALARGEPTSPTPALAAARGPLGPRLLALVHELDVAAQLGDAREVCVTAVSPERREDVLADLLAEALGHAGFAGAARCPAGAADARDEDLDGAARAAGFEWRAVARQADAGLTVELRAVDRGLWAPADRPVIAAWAEEPPASERTSDPSPTPSPPGLEPGLEPGLRVVRVLGLDRAVRALAACDLTGDGTPELATLLDDRVLVWRERRGSYAVAGEWDFRELPRATVRVRDPIGGCVCAPMGPGGAARLAIGHSDVERGAVLVARSEGNGLRLERERAFTGLPLAWGAGGLISAAPDQGRNRVGPTVAFGERTVELARAIREIAAPPAGSQGRLVALDGEHQVVALSEGLALSSLVAASGAGIAQVPARTGLTYLAVTSRLRGPSDVVRLIDPASGATAFGPVGIAGQVVATAAAPRAGELWIAALTAEGERTSIFRLTVVEGAP